MSTRMIAWSSFRCTVSEDNNMHFTPNTFLTLLVDAIYKRIHLTKVLGRKPPKTILRIVLIKQKYISEKTKSSPYFLVFIIHTPRLEWKYVLKVPNRRGKKRNTRLPMKQKCKIISFHTAA